MLGEEWDWPDLLPCGRPAVQHHPFRSPILPRGLRHGLCLTVLSYACPVPARLRVPRPGTLRVSIAQASPSLLCLEMPQPGPGSDVHEREAGWRRTEQETKP